MGSQGIFLDVIGLSYHCGAFSGTTAADYAYSYEPDAVVTFSVGLLVVGKSIGKPSMTVSDLVPLNTSISDPRLINRARLLYSLSPGQGFELPITIDANVGALDDLSFFSIAGGFSPHSKGSRRNNKVRFRNQSRFSE